MPDRRMSPCRIESLPLATNGRKAAAIKEMFAQSTGGKAGTDTTPTIGIPVPFEAAVEGLLEVDPKQPVESVRKKPAKKKAGKKG